jgi:hypothetical protein
MCYIVNVLIYKWGDRLNTHGYNPNFDYLFKMFFFNPKNKRKKSVFQCI